MRTGTKDDVWMVKRRNLAKRHLLVAFLVLPDIESDAVGNFTNLSIAPNPILNAVHGCATDAQGSIYAAGMKTGTIHVSEAGNAERNHKLAFVRYRADDIPLKASVGSNNT